MPKLPVTDGRRVVRALERAGLIVRRQRGSHVVLTNPGKTVEVAVPVHGSRDLKPGTLRGIIRDAGLTVDEFRKMLK